MKIRSLTQIRNLRGKKVLLRVDFNVAMKGKKIIEAYRIDRCLPTIKYLLKKHCQVIIVSHLGRPEGKPDLKFSLSPVVNELRRKLKAVPLAFVRGSLENSQTLKNIKQAKQPIVVLENLRFHPGEEANSSNFAKILASLADIYVNDAFAVCHRQAASLVAITKFLPSYGGINLLDEIKFLSTALKPQRPAVAIVGGVKLDSKFGVIKKFLNKYDAILTGGGVANLFLKAQGYEIGQSIIDAKYLAAAKGLVKNKKICWPIDYVIADFKNHKGIRRQELTSLKSLCSKNEAIFDIGPYTMAWYDEQISRAKTIVWVGPVGLTDEAVFAKGSRNLARVIGKYSSKPGVVSMAGGGETIAVINQVKVGRRFDFISTGGGAMLEFLEGKILPGIKPLIKK